MVFEISLIILSLAPVITHLITVRLAPVITQCRRKERAKPLKQNTPVQKVEMSPMRRERKMQGDKNGEE